MRCKLALLFITVIMLCGCKQLSLKNRAIVQTIYANNENGMVTVSILAFESEPETDISAAQGIPKIYKGYGATLEKAFEAAEEKSNRMLFYAHNRILLIGSGYEKDITSCIKYFGGGALPRDMDVFYADFDSAHFDNWQENADFFVRECETIADEYSNKMYEIRSSKSLSGFLPVLTANADSEDVSSDSIIVFNNGKLFFEFNSNAMELIYALSHKKSKIVLTAENVRAKLRTSNIERNIVDNCINVILHLYATAITENGELIRDDKQRRALEELNTEVNKIVIDINNILDKNNADLFGMAEWYCMQTKADNKPLHVNISCIISK